MKPRRKLPQKPALYWLFSVALGVLTGCVALPTPDSGWLLRGKIGVEQDGKPYTARFYWLAPQPDSYRIDLWGPLGQGRVRLEGDALRLTVRDAQNRLLADGPPAQVMQRQLGWSLPITLARAWMLGRPADTPPTSGVLRDEQGRLLAFQQQGWRIQFDYPERAEQAGLPERIRLERRGIQVRIAVSGRRAIND